MSALPTSMRAMQLERPGGRFELVELPVPQPAAGEVLLEVAACGVCRTDLHVVDGDITDGRYPVIPGHQIVARVVTVTFLVFSPIMFVLGRRVRRHFGLQAGIGLCFDLVFNLMMFRVAGGIESGIGVLLAGAMGAAGAILPLQSALMYAAAATIAVLWQAVIEVLAGNAAYGSIVPHGLLGAAFFATALLGAYLARRTRESRAILLQRSEDVANLATLNEMIIQRMRTGILIIGPKENTHVMNDSAWYLLGMPDQRNGKLEQLAADLAPPLRAWRAQGRHSHESLRLASGVPPVVPRFARLGTSEPSDTLVFLEDTSMVSRRAQEMTLSSLGRLSASIAHEIRNPLAAISHSAQLLAESESVSSSDQRLTEIITRHCGRMNEIIENVLQLARQQPARPELVSLDRWIDDFRDEFSRVNELQNFDLEATAPRGEVLARIDPGQLQQVVWNLCQNAIKYGRSEDGKARVRLTCGYAEEEMAPFLEVADQGQGIDEGDQERIFQPFFTSSPDGTGLGLYLCQQLCAANQAAIEYRSGFAHTDGAGTGSTFRILLPTVRSESADDDASQSSTSLA